MSTKQKIILAAITLAVAAIEVSQGIAETIFGAVIAFGITYFFIYRYNKRANMTPEEKATIQARKEQRVKQRVSAQEAKQQARLAQKNEQLKLKEEKRHNVEQEKIAKSKVKMEKAESARKKRYEKAAKREEIRAALQEANKENQKLKCPNCGSTNIQPLGQHRKGFSVGKAVGGAVLTGGVGTLAGFAGKNTKKTTFVCMDCGKQFIR